MKKYFFVILLLISLSVFFSGCAGFRVGFPEKPEQPTAIDLVLDKIFLERDDLAISLDTYTGDPFLLNSVQQFLNSPVRMISFSDNVENRFQKFQGLHSIVTFCADMLGAPVHDREMPEGIDEILYPDYAAIVQNLYDAMGRAIALFNEAFSELDYDETVFIKDKLEQLLFYGRNQESLTRKENQDATNMAFLLAAKIDLKKIVGACYRIASSLDTAIPGLIKESMYPDNGILLSTPLGNIIVGSRADDIYDGVMPLILIEPGGDDTYAFKTHSTFSVIVDLNGNDTYKATSNVPLASGIMGMGFLVDIEGDDLYQGENFSFGCGFLGSGLLADFSGNDRYIAQVFSEGAATLGIGVLYDTGGNDFYQCDLYGQGMGYVGGTGILADILGDDIIKAGNVVPDSREETGAFQTYSQGFGLGCRMFASGGLGILYNGKGSDTYMGSYFCQGSSYWHALGVLIDTEGDDTYLARRYSQGAGIHSSAGILSDRSGDDIYSSWGVSQGCGHDLSVGILHDKQGNDRYDAEWLSQGAGNSSGIGILIDDKGDDIYRTGSNNTIQGSGVYDKRRDAESIGILVDRDGEDTFSGNTGEIVIWTRGEIGGGIDHDGELASVWHDPAEKFLFNGSNFSFRENIKTGNNSCKNWLLPELEAPLFSEASWERAAESLSEKGPEIIPPLLKYLTIKDVLVQRTVEETLKKIGIEYLSDIHGYLQQEETGVMEKKFLLYVLGDIKNIGSKDIFKEFLNNKNSSVQAMALRGLYKLNTPPHIEMSEKLFKTGNSEIKKYLCLSLRASEDQKSLKLLYRLLADDDFQVRHAAYRVLKERKQQDIAFLKKLKKKHGILPSVSRMADDIEGLGLNNN